MCECSRLCSKVEAMKPVLLKAGIPLAVSVAGFVLAKIVARKSSVPTASSSQIQITNVEDRGEDDHALEEEISGLRRRVENMQDRELLLEKRFVYYQGLKDQETVLMDLHNKMEMEITRVDFLEKEVSLVQAESQRVESLAREYLELLRLDEFLKSENEKLCKGVKKLLRKSKEHSSIMRKQCLQIQCKETVISRNITEIKELKLIIQELQGEINELLLAASMEEKKSKASEVEEVIYLRWTNACLKNERMRKNQENDREENKKDDAFERVEELGSDNELNQRAAEEDGSYFGSTPQDHARDHSKRRRLIAKFKRWVEGSEKPKLGRLVEREKNGNKCFTRNNSVSDGAEEDSCLLARKSCSSV